MKKRFYVDVYEWANYDTDLFATTNPAPISNASTKRYAFDVSLPDPIAFRVERVLPEVSKPELVENHND